MQILSTIGWDDYELLDSGDGYRLERFGNYILSRPDPQIIWKKSLATDIWQKVDAIFERTIQDKGQWVKKNKNLPDSWQMRYKNLSFLVKLSPFKHTGVFPEQHLQWEWIRNQIELSRSDNTQKISTSESQNTRNSDISDTQNNRVLSESYPNILNLFAYTGIASLAAVSAGAKVTHVDASKPTIGWARENQTTSHLEDKPIRWILDDCLKFVGREIKRGVKYDGIIMDPPAFGHDPDGNVWKFNDHFPKLLDMCTKILSDKPLFVLVNAYAISSSSLMLQNVLEDFMKPFGGSIEVGELALEEKTSHRLLSTGIFGRWSS